MAATFLMSYKIDFTTFRKTIYTGNTAGATSLTLTEDVKNFDHLLVYVRGENNIGSDAVCVAPVKDDGSVYAGFCEFVSNMSDTGRQFFSATLKGSGTSLMVLQESYINVYSNSIEYGHTSEFYITKIVGVV